MVALAKNVRVSRKPAAGGARLLTSRSPRPSTLDSRHCELVEIVDLFCGAGGTSTGILQACEDLGFRRVRLTAVNHWTVALNSHSLNLVSDRAKGVEVRHILEPVENLWPARVIPSRRLHLLAASCECTFHSNARGGGPCNEQSRAQAWQLIRWCTDLQVDNLLMENVREFLKWGPLLTQGIRWRGRYYRKDTPDPRRQGEFFKAFVRALQNLGYGVDWKIQVAGDYGDPTSRPRLMLLACLGRAPRLPDCTHGPMKRVSPHRVECQTCNTTWNFKRHACCPKCRLQPHGEARQCIDFSIIGKSMFKPDGTVRHCDNTVERIKAGLRLEGGPAAEPFLLILNGTSKSHLAKCVRSLNDLMPGLTCSNHVMLCQPKKFLMHLTHHGSDNNRVHSLDKLMPSVTGAHRGEIALVEPIIVQTDHQSAKPASYVRSTNKLLPSIVTKQSMLIVQMIMKYYRTGICKSLDKQLDAITTRDRFRLVEFKGVKRGKTVIGFDILTRLLQPHELAAAHSFPKNYQFTGTKEDAVKQIGNSVPVKLARAHALAQLQNLLCKRIPSSSPAR